MSARFNYSSMSIHIGSSLVEKTCHGDYVITPDDIALPTGDSSIILNTAPQESAAQTSRGSKGGSSEWWLFALLTMVTCRRSHTKKDALV